MQSLRILALTTAFLGVAFIGSLATAPAAVGAPAQVCKEDEVRIGVPLKDDDRCVGGKENPIYEYVKVVIRFLAASVGLIAVFILIVSGLQYITAQGNSDQIRSAKNRLTNVIIGLVLYIMSYGILEWLIPGKIFG